MAASPLQEVYWKAVTAWRPLLPEETRSVDDGKRKLTVSAKAQKPFGAVEGTPSLGSSFDAQGFARRESG